MGNMLIRSLYKNFFKIFLNHKWRACIIHLYPKFRLVTSYIGWDNVKTLLIFKLVKIFNFLKKNFFEKFTSPQCPRCVFHVVFNVVYYVVQTLYKRCTRPVPQWLAGCGWYHSIELFNICNRFLEKSWKFFLKKI